MKSRLHLAAVCLILVVAAALRGWHLDDKSLWMDELCSLECSNGWGLSHIDLPPGVVNGTPAFLDLPHARPISDISSQMSRHESSPPLYVLCLRLWRQIFGDSDAALRGLSATLSWASLIFLYLAVRIQFGESTALLALLLAAVSPMQIQFAREARTYALSGFLGLLAAWAVARIERHGFRQMDGAVLACCAFSLPFTHYFNGSLDVALALYVAWALRGRERGWALGALGIGVLVFAVACVPVMLGQANRLDPVTTSWMLEDPRGHDWLVLWRMLLLPAELTIYITQPPWPYLFLAMVLVMPLWLARRQPQLMMWWAVLLLPASALAVIDLVKDMRFLTFGKYLLAGGAACGTLVAAMRWPGRHFLYGPMLLLALWRVPQAYTTGPNTRWDQDFRGLARSIEERHGPRDAVVAINASWPDWYRGTLYVAMQRYLRWTPPLWVLLREPADGTVLAALRSCPQVWLLGQFGALRPQEILKGWQIVGPPQDFPNVGRLYCMRAVEPKE